MTTLKNDSRIANSGNGEAIEPSNDIINIQPDTTGSRGDITKDMAGNAQVLAGKSIKETADLRTHREGVSEDEKTAAINSGGGQETNSGVDADQPKQSVGISDGTKAPGTTTPNADIAGRSDKVIDEESGKEVGIPKVESLVSPPDARTPVQAETVNATLPRAELIRPNGAAGKVTESPKAVSEQPETKIESKPTTGPDKAPPSKVENVFTSSDLKPEPIRGEKVEAGAKSGHTVESPIKERGYSESPKGNTPSSSREKHPDPISTRADPPSRPEQTPSTTGRSTPSSPERHDLRTKEADTSPQAPISQGAKKEVATSETPQNAQKGVEPTREPVSPSGAKQAPPPSAEVSTPRTAKETISTATPTPVRESSVPKEPVHTAPSAKKETPAPETKGLKAEQPQSQKIESPKAETPRVEPLRPTNKSETEPKRTEAPQPKIIEKPEIAKTTETSRNEGIVLAAKLRELSQQITSSNTKEIVRVQAKDELSKVVEQIIKKATFEGKAGELVQVIKQVVTEPAVKEAIRMITSSSSDSNSLKELKALLQQAALIRGKEGQEQKLDISTVTTKRVEDIQAPVITKEAAMQALVGILVDADKITSRLVREVQVETASKLSQIQSTIDELIKLRVEQFVSLSVKGYGVDGVTFKTLCQETIAELANRYGLSDQQRALLNQILIQITESDFKAHDPVSAKEQDKNKEPKEKIKVDPNAKELTPKEIEALFKKEIEVLEEFLKEREEIKRAKAEAELVNLLAELVDESMSYKIDEDLEIVKVFTISGQVTDPRTRRPLRGIRIVAGILGEYTTDADGVFTIRNVPEGTTYIVGADHPDYIFTPPYHSGTLEMSVSLVFEGTSSNLEVVH